MSDEDRPTDEREERWKPSERWQPPRRDDDTPEGESPADARTTPEPEIPAVPAPGESKEFGAGGIGVRSETPEKPVPPAPSDSPSWISTPKVGDPFAPTSPERPAAEPTAPTPPTAPSSPAQRPWDLPKIDPPSATSAPGSTAPEITRSDVTEALPAGGFAFPKAPPAEKVEPAAPTASVTATPAAPTRPWERVVPPAQTPTPAIPAPGSTPRPWETRQLPPIPKPETPAPSRIEHAAHPERRPVGEVRKLRRGRLAIRKFDPVSIFRFSMIFYFCTMLVLLLAGGLIYTVLRVVGVVGNIEQLVAELIRGDFKISGFKLFFYGFIAGSIWSVVMSVVTTFAAFLYNLIADVVGGVEMIVVERDQ